MMVLRSVMPNKVTKPTSEPMDNQPLVNITASTPPISANGRFKKVINRLRKLPRARYSNTMTPTMARAA